MLEQTPGQENVGERSPFERDLSSPVERFSSEELFASAKSGFSSCIPHKFTEDYLANFIQENVEGARINGANLMFVHQDYGELQGRMDAVLGAYEVDSGPAAA